MLISDEKVHYAEKAQIFTRNAMSLGIIIIILNLKRKKYINYFIKCFPYYMLVIIILANEMSRP